jgi:SAM-dependent methyltransferase
VVEGAGGRGAVRPPQPGLSVKAIGKTAFARAARKSRYLRGRWPYLRHAARIIAELDPASVLEVGPGPHPFVPGSVRLDVNERMSPEILHDASDAPWPVESGAFDLVLALQVFEHLGPRTGEAQRRAFDEARRVAGPRGHVLLSFPFLWLGSSPAHTGIDRKTIRMWTSGVEPEQTILCRVPKNRQRLVALWTGASDE